MFPTFVLHDNSGPTHTSDSGLTWSKWPSRDQSQCESFDIARFSPFSAPRARRANPGGSAANLNGRMTQARCDLPASLLQESLSSQ